MVGTFVPVAGIDPRRLDAIKGFLPSSSQRETEMPTTQDQADWFAEAFERLVENVSLAIVDKKDKIRQVLVAFLSSGHVLLEDLPGSGKTSLAKALANTVAGSVSQIRFTSDLLPSDITGVTIYSQASGKFEFHPGPIFASVVLADDINRASPRTQSALLEVMEEGTVTVDGIAHHVGSPFFVIATQSPADQQGTFPLPDAQLDRFMMKTSLGYPGHDATVALLLDSSNKSRVSDVKAIISVEVIATMQQLASDAFVNPSVMDYISQIASATRVHKDVAVGVSVRGALALARAIRPLAMSRGRTYAIADDVTDLVLPVLAHRIVVDPESEFVGTTAARILESIVQGIEQPEHSGSPDEEQHVLRGEA